MDWIEQMRDFFCWYFALHVVALTSLALGINSRNELAAREEMMAMVRLACSYALSRTYECRERRSIEGYCTGMMRLEAIFSQFLLWTTATPLVGLSTILHYVHTV